jgi:hypothetical protein
LQAKKEPSKGRGEAAIMDFQQIKNRPRRINPPTIALGATTTLIWRR